MNYVLITLSIGQIISVKFYPLLNEALRDFINFSKRMDHKKEDASIYGPEGFVANARDILKLKEWDEEKKPDRSLYILVNPFHSLGSLVLSMDEPLAYPYPLDALLYLEQVRKEYGRQILIYKAQPLSNPLVKKKDFEAYIERRKITDFDFGMIEEYFDTSA